GNTPSTLSASPDILTWRNRSASMLRVDPDAQEGGSVDPGVREGDFAHVPGVVRQADHELTTWPPPRHQRGEVGVALLTLDGRHNRRRRAPRTHRRRCGVDVDRGSPPVPLLRCGDELSTQV